jgi:hypothetical protein
MKKCYAAALLLACAAFAGCAADSLPACSDAGSEDVVRRIYIQRSLRAFGNLGGGRPENKEQEDKAVEELLDKMRPQLVLDGVMTVANEGRRKKCEAKILWRDPSGKPTDPMLRNWMFPDLGVDYEIKKLNDGRIWVDVWFRNL